MARVRYSTVSGLPRFPTFQSMSEWALERKIRLTAAQLFTAENLLVSIGQTYFVTTRINADGTTCKTFPASEIDNLFDGLIDFECSALDLTRLGELIGRRPRWLTLAEWAANFRCTHLNLERLRARASRLAKKQHVSPRIEFTFDPLSDTVTDDVLLPVTVLAMAATSLPEMGAARDELPPATAEEALDSSSSPSAIPGGTH